MLAILSTSYGDCPLAAACRSRLMLAAYSLNFATIVLKTAVADVPGSKSYVAGYRNPSMWLLPHVGNPTFDGLAMTFSNSASGTPVASAATCATLFARMPSVTMTTRPCSMDWSGHSMLPARSSAISSCTRPLG